jgi:hypothetical protein
MQWRLQWCKCGKERVKPKSKEPFPALQQRNESNRRAPIPNPETMNAPKTYPQKFLHGRINEDFVIQIETDLIETTVQRDRLAEALEEMRYGHTDKAESMAIAALAYLENDERTCADD